jgi:hypothetical protein
VLSVDGEKRSLTKVGGRYRQIKAGASLAPLRGAKACAFPLTARRTRHLRHCVLSAKICHETKLLFPMAEHVVQRSNPDCTRSIITGR